MSNIATLGLEFKSGTAGSQIKTLCNRFDTLEKKCGSVQQALDKLFGSLPGKISASSTAIGKLNSGLMNIARFSGAANASLTQINSILAGMSKRKIDPVGAAAAKKAADLTLAMQNLANVMTKIPTNKLNFNPVVNNTNSLGNSVNALGGHADVASIALRSLQGALSINYLKNAVAKTIELGTELAYIKSIAMELNTNQIGSSLMNFSSMLGGPAENAEALYYAYSSGIRGTEEDFIKFTEIASKTAQVNRATLKPMIDAMTAAMNAYGMSVDRAGEVADNFFAIVKYGKASGEQLANSFGQVSPTAKTLGLTLDELGAGIASLTKIQPTRVAITGLNNMLSKIMKPTKESRLALEKLGVDMSYSAVQSKGFVTVLREVHDALGGNMEALKNIFPDIRGQRAAMHLLGAGWSDFNIQLDNFANKKDAMDTAFKVLTDDVNVQLKQIPVTLNKITTEAGSMAVHFMTLGGILNPVVTGFNEMGEYTRKFFAAITLLVGVYGSYKALSLAINTYHAIQIRNNQVLINQQRELATSAMAAQAAQNSASGIANLQNEINKRIELSTARKYEIMNLKESVGDKQMLAFEEGNIARALQLTTRMMQLENIEITNNCNLLKQQNALKEASKLQSATPATAASFASNFLTGPAQSGSSFGDLSRDIQYQKDAALAQALHNAELQRGAAVNGEYAAAARLSKAAQSDYANFLRLSTMQQKVNTLSQKAASLQTKASAASTKLASMWYKAGAVSVKMYANATVILSAKLQILKRSIQTLLATAWPLLVISLAIEGLILLFDKLDVSGSKALEAQNRKLAQIDEHFSAINQKRDEDISKAKESARTASDAATRLSEIVKLGKLNNLEIQATGTLIKSVNDYLGFTAVSYDAVNKSIRTQTNLLDAVKKKNKEILELQYKRKISEAEQMRTEYDDLQKKAMENIETKNGWWYNAWRNLFTSFPLLGYKIGRATEDDYKSYEDAAKGYRRSVLEVYNLRRDAAAAIARENMKDALSAQEASKKVRALESKLREAQNAADFAKLTDIGKIVFINDEISELTENIAKYQRSIKVGLTSDGVSWEEQTADAQLQIFKKKQEIIKLNSEIQKQNFKMMSPDQQLAETRRRYLENGKAYFDAVESGNSEAAQKSFQALIGDYKTLRDAAMKKIEENRKLTEKLQKMRDDALLKAAPTDSAKYAIYQKRMNDSFNESMAKARSGDYSGAADSYQKSYEAAAQMASMQNKLAQAEMNANDKTRQMILSLDKFKTSAVGVVNANSSDALKLQSRRFDALPAYQPQNTQQNIAAQQNQAMAQSMTQSTGWLQEMVDQDTQKQQSEQGYYDNLWKQIGDANKENLGNIETALSQIINQLTGKMRVTVDNGFNIKSVRL